MERILGAAIAALLLAGCSSPVAMLPGSLDPISHDLALGTATCDGATLLLAVDPEIVAPFLPPGFHFRDPQAMLGMPVATGSAAIFVAAVQCVGGELAEGGFDLGFIAILVEPPVVADVEGSATYDFYGLSHVTGTPSLAAWMDAHHMAPHVSPVTVDAALPTAQATVMSAQAGSGADQQFTFNLAAPAPILEPTPGLGYQDALLRVWVQHDDGLTLTEHAFSADVPIGSGTCSFPAGSDGARVLGMTQCPLPGDRTVVLGGGFPGVEIHSSVRALPGAVAQ